MELKYETRQVNMMVGKVKKHIGTVEVPTPTPETLQAYIDQGVITQDELCRMYINAKAVALQAEKRRQYGTVETYEKAFGRLWSKFGTGDNLKAISAYAEVNGLSVQTEINKFLKDVFENGESQEYAAEYISALTDETEVKN